MVYNVKNIRVTAVNFSKIETGFDVAVNFETEISAAGENPTDFFIFWYEDDVFKNNYKLTKSQTMLSLWTIGTTNFQPDVNKKCTLRIGYSTDHTLAEQICKYPAAVVTQSYTNIKGTYNGRKFFVTWDKFTKPVTTKLQFTHDHSFYESEIGKKYIEFDLSPRELESGMILDFKLLSCLETNNNGYKCLSMGIDSASVKAYSSAIVPICAAKAGENIELKLDIPNYTALSVNKDGRILKKTDYQITKTEDSCKVVILREDIPASLKDTVLRTYIRIGDFVTEIDLPDNILPLGTPDVTTELDGVNGKLRFSMDGADGYYLLIDGDTPQTEYTGEKIYAQSDVLGKTAQVAAAYAWENKSLIGPYSEPVPFFKEAFYANETGLTYYSEYGKESVSVSLDEKIYDDAEFAGIELGPFKLTSGNYTFTIDYTKGLTVDNLKSFINKLFDNPISVDEPNDTPARNLKIKPYGYYRINDLIARLSPCAYADGLFYYCRAANGGMSNELMPGFSLKVETAYFNKQSSASAEDDNGFIKGAVSEYDVCFNGTNLEFNSCIDYIGESWTSASLKPNDDLGGLIDLFRFDLRSPYFKVVYPSAFFGSSHFPQTGDDGNILLCTEEPNIADYTDKKKLMRFRGRAAITTEITVNVNDRAVKVPLGMTVGKLTAIYGGGKLTMRRQTGLGYAVPVYFADSAHIQNLFLLAGDSLSFT